MVNGNITDHNKFGVDEVIHNGYCVGCGACASVEDSSHEMVRTKYGTYEARRVSENATYDSFSADKVCPFSDKSLREDVIAAELFMNQNKDSKLGGFLSTHAGYVQEKQFRSCGSSGGMGTWILEELLVGGYIDAVVHVGVTDEEGSESIYGYKISTTIDELRKGAKSKYYPITLEKVVRYVRENPARYAFSGVPCFIKAVRLIAKEDDQFGKSVSYCIGLFCGHLKSSAFAEFLAWQMGIQPSNLKHFDFRMKLGGESANKYGVKAIGKVNDGFIEKLSPMEDLYGKDWGLGLFKLNACDYCDDVVAETADISIGDAWLPKYVKDSEGTNLIIIRNRVFSEILDKGKKAARIKLEDVDPGDIVRSQGSGYNHRREGLAYRLWLADLNKVPRPEKRVKPESLFGKRFEKRHRLRMEMARMSHEYFLEAKQGDNIKIFFDKIIPISDQYYAISKSRTRKILSKIKHKLLNILQQYK